MLRITYDYVILQLLCYSIICHIILHHVIVQFITYEVEHLLVLITVDYYCCY